MVLLLLLLLHPRPLQVLMAHLQQRLLLLLHAKPLLRFALSIIELQNQQPLWLL